MDNNQDNQNTNQPNSDDTQAFKQNDDLSYAMGQGSIQSERPFDTSRQATSSDNITASTTEASHENPFWYDGSQTMSEGESPSSSMPGGEAAKDEAPQAEYVQAEQVSDGDTHRPGDIIRNMNTTTKKKKKRPQWMKYLAVLLIGAIIGGASGGVVASKVGGTKITTVSTPRNTEEISYDANGDMTISTIANKAMPAVVSVYNIGSTSNSIFGGSQSSATSYGSGVIISSDGMIVTNYHVIENANSVVVVTDDDKKYEAKVLGADSSLDLAVLKIEASDLPYLEIADSDELQVGDLAVAIGNPLGSEFANTVTDGIISGLDRNLSSESGETGFIQTNASINSGNSGGALVNGQAQLIGINSMKIQSNGMTSVEGMGFAIPSNTVVNFVNSVKDGSNTNNSTKGAWLGISGYNMDEDIANQIGVSQNTGVLVGEITEAGPASSAGLQIGDIIVGIDGESVENFNDLTAALKEKQPNDTVKLTIIRGEEQGEVSVTLGTKS